jgi:outer membrane lipoprotein-sorting protein
MKQEMSWYVESGRFSGIYKNLEGKLGNYAAAKKHGAGEDELYPLREEARLLFEDHAVRSGLREEGSSFINIDAEFFDGEELNKEASDGFIKSILKGHGYQSILWMYMGTTGSMTVVSKREMAAQGLRYENYLPVEYKKKHPPQKPFANRVGNNEELFYIYGDGSISKEYVAEKAKMRFNRLQDTSGMDWKKGYDPNGNVVKNGWHGKWDHNGVWVKEKGEEARSAAAGKDGLVTIELVRNGDGVILYDPGNLLLTAPMLMYLTESGEPYGNLEFDREKTLIDIRKALTAMGVSGIGAVAGIEDGDKTALSAYKEVLVDLAAPTLAVVDAAAAREAKETQEHAEVVADAIEMNQQWLYEQEFILDKEDYLKLLIKHKELKERMW